MEDLLPVEYFHVVFTLPSQVADIAYQIKAEVYGLLFKASSETLRFFGDLTKRANPEAFTAHVAPLRKTNWVVYAKPHFGEPKAVLAYLSRYTHLVAISNHRLVSADTNSVAFRRKDYRIKRGDRMKVVRMAANDFIRRFLIHVLPSGSHRTRYIGLLANGIRRDKIAKIRCFLEVEVDANPKACGDPDVETDERKQSQTCPKCSGTVMIIETFLCGQSDEKISKTGQWMRKRNPIGKSRL